MVGAVPPAQNNHHPKLAVRLVGKKHFELNFQLCIKVVLLLITLWRQGGYCNHTVYRICCTFPPPKQSASDTTLHYIDDEWDPTHCGKDHRTGRHNQDQDSTRTCGVGQMAWLTWCF